MYDWVCYVCGVKRKVTRKNPPAHEPIEEVCHACRRKAFGFEGIEFEGRHTEHKDRSSLELLGGESPYTVLYDMMNST